MGCLVVLLALITPRVVMVVLWVFTDYLSRAFEGFLWPLLGFFFLPTTTMAYAVATNEFDGVRGWGLAIVILGILIDFGLIGGGRSAGRRRR
jgi:apolipoprotein N-acyltransferase